LSRRLVAIPLRYADPVRATAGARTFFVTSSICENRSLLQSDRSAALFMHVLYDYRAQRKFRLHEFVVMPDHFHLLLTVECGMTIERAVQFVKGGFAFRAGRELGLGRPFGKEDFRRCGFLIQKHSGEVESTFAITQLRGIWLTRRKSMRILPPIRDSRPMWRRRN
jgi:REP element-mobilizing transposase RayT